MPSEREELAKLLRQIEQYPIISGIPFTQPTPDGYFLTAETMGKVQDTILAIQQRVDAAVQAERERCAGIASSHALRQDKPHLTTLLNATVAGEIAAAIRSGESLDSSKSKE